jgi:hypothetical protein
MSFTNIMQTPPHALKMLISMMLLFGFSASTCHLMSKCLCAVSRYRQLNELPWLAGSFCKRIVLQMC